MDPDCDQAEPSPFYDLFVGAKSYVLLVPMDLDMGVVAEDGLVRWKDSDLGDDEFVQAVPLGGNRYRLAERVFGPMTALPIQWGDEFYAESRGRSILRLTGFVTPRAFAHFTFDPPAVMNSSHPLAAAVHALGGGWELYPRKEVTFSVPSYAAAEFMMHVEIDEARTSRQWVKVERPAE